MYFFLGGETDSKESGLRLDLSLCMLSWQELDWLYLYELRMFGNMEMDSLFLSILPKIMKTHIMFTYQNGR